MPQIGGESLVVELTTEDGPTALAVAVSEIASLDLWEDKQQRNGELTDSEPPD